MAYYKNDLSVQKIIGKKLKKLRKERGLTMKDICDLVGAAQSTMFGWERGSHHISIESLFKYSSVLGIHPSEILPSYSEYKPKLILKIKSENGETA